MGQSLSANWFLEMTTPSTNSSGSSSNSVVLPPSLAVLVSNFHTLVTTKLDSTNYLLWRIPVENAVRANGYYEYLEGSVGCPPIQIKDNNGHQAPRKTKGIASRTGLPGLEIK